MTRNQLQYFANQEIVRANQAQEGIKRDTLSETRRSNLANEDVKRGELDVKRGELSVKQDTLKETRRHNRHSEAQGYIKNYTDALGAIGRVGSAAANFI